MVLLSLCQGNLLSGQSSKGRNMSEEEAKKTAHWEEFYAKVLLCFPSFRVSERLSNRSDLIRSSDDISRRSIFRYHRGDGSDDYCSHRSQFEKINQETLFPCDLLSSPISLLGNHNRHQQLMNHQFVRFPILTAQQSILLPRPPWPYPRRASRR